jgi:hypothetical protein
MMNNFGQSYEFQVSTMLALYGSWCLEAISNICLMHVEALQVHFAGLCGVSVLMTLGLLVSSYVTEALHVL